jgi:hypothetical protein
VVYAIHAATKHISPRLRALLDFLAEWFHARERDRGLAVAKPRTMAAE